MSRHYARHALVLGLLTAIGPFAIDMYLPALPAIADGLNTSTAAVQMTIMAYFVGFGISQLIYGPASDILGRKRPLYFGLALFALASIGCALAPSIQWLIFFRFVQGLGSSGPMVIVRAVIRDLHTGVEAAKLMSLIMLVFSVSPILAPLTGSALIVPFGWRAVFVAITLSALIGIVLAAIFLPETHPRGKRVQAELKLVRRGYGTLLRDPRFLGLCAIGGLGISGFFAFLASSSFIYIEHYGLTPAQFSFAFSVNAIGFIGSSQFSAMLGSRFGLSRVITAAVGVFTVFSLLLFGVTLAGADNLFVLMAFLFIAFASLGLVIAPSMVMAMDEHGPIAGMASALAGTLHMFIGGSVVAITSVFFNDTPLPMVATIACCAVGALIVTRLTLKKREPMPESLRPISLSPKD